MSMSSPKSMPRLAWGPDLIALALLLATAVAVLALGAIVGVERAKTERARYEHGCIPEPTP